MPLTRTQKEEVVKTMSSDLQEAVSAVFISYNGLTVEEVNGLRNNLYEVGCRMRIVPKRLLNLVIKNTKLQFDPMGQEGQLAVVWGSDAVAPAKILYEFAKKNEHVTLLAGVLEHEEIALEQVQSLAKLPSREQLLGQFVGVLAGPMRGMVCILSGVQRQMVYVLQAIGDSRK